MSRHRNDSRPWTNELWQIVGKTSHDIFRAILPLQRLLNETNTRGHVTRRTVFVGLLVSATTDRTGSAVYQRHNGV
jgi:hypothetical protein